MKNRFGRLLLLPLILLAAVVLLPNGGLHAATLFQQVGIASSPSPVGSGARAVGMGGAFISVADDATAASWNPAGLIQLERPELSIVGAYFNRKTSFTSGSQSESNNDATVDDFNLNYFSATYPFKFYRNVVVSVNYQRLYEFKHGFDYVYDYSVAGVDLVQNKQYRQNGHVDAVGLATAVQVTPALSLGGTLNVWTDKFMWSNGWKETFTELGVGTQAGVPLNTDTRIIDEYSQFRGFNANLGLLWDINERLTFGAVVKTPFEATLRHDFDYINTSVLGPPTNTTTISRQRVIEDIELKMPLSYGAGLAWRVSDSLSFALDIYRTHWSEYILTDADGNKFSPITGLAENVSDVTDTTQVRAGGEYLFIGNKFVIPARGGLFYDPEPSSRGGTKDFYGIALGSGIVYNNLIFDMAYQLRWAQDVDTGNLIASTESDVYQHLVMASLIMHL